MLMEFLLGKKAMLVVLGWAISAIGLFSGWMAKQVWDAKEDHEKRIIVIESVMTTQTSLLIEIRDELRHGNSQSNE